MALIGILLNHLYKWSGDNGHTIALLHTYCGGQLLLTNYCEWPSLITNRNSNTVKAMFSKYGFFEYLSTAPKYLDRTTTPACSPPLLSDSILLAVYSDPSSLLSDSILLAVYSDPSSL